MLRWSDRDQTVLISSDDRLPAHAFHGYAFVGSDLVVGDQGADEYRRGGGRLSYGEDGAYCVIEQVADTAWTMGTDYQGFCHLLYYTFPDGRWLVSNSYVTLFRSLIVLGVEPSLNAAVVQAYAAHRDLVRSLMSFDSPSHGIRLLPSSAVLRLTPGPSPALAVERVDVEADSAGSYERALARFLDIWSARLRAAVLDQRLSFTVHVSGGQDSRTVLAMLAAMVPEVGSRVADRMQFYSEPHRPDDLAVAARVAAALGLRLNRPATHGRVRRLSAREAFRRWEESSVGCYTHPVFPEHGYTTTHMVVAGVGGEAHRRTYRPRIANLPIEAVADVFGDRFHDAEAHQVWKASLVEADAWLRECAGAHPLALVRNHREFRNRFHSGKQTSYGIALLPLCSKYLTECSNRLSPDSFDTGQLLFDIMASTTPRLMDIPFDRDFKAPTVDHRQRLTAVPIGTAPGAGSVVAPSVVDDSPDPAPEAATPVSLLLASIAGVLDNRTAVELVGADVLRSGVDEARTHLGSPLISLHAQGRYAHLAYLLNLLC